MKRTTAAVLALALVLALLPVSPTLGQSVYPGYHFAFGHFEQDGFMVNGQEPIIWRVLDVDSGAGTAGGRDRAAVNGDRATRAPFASADARA